MLRASKISRRFLATAGKYPVGSKLHGYVIEQAEQIPELSLVAVKLYNAEAKTHHLHLDSPNDGNNVFSIAFKTNAPDNTGLPHILEHLVLCGSETFPVRDPFFKMTNRSLSNFMNAMTGHDFTFYPFATTNSKDFENLMDVYLSSVFLPTLTRNNFNQEGWRLEHEKSQDSTSPVIFKGVVYNEMKGQNSNSDYYFYKSYLEAVYPTLNNSGGNPENIPDLKHEAMTSFYKRTYHPANCKTFTYGNFPLENHLEKITEYFGKVDRKGEPAGIKYPVFNDSYVDSTVEVKGPADSMSVRPIDHQYKASITWNLGNPLDAANDYEFFLWKLLNSLLVDGHSSPFYQELVETDLADDFSANTGVDSTTALYSFTMGLNNCTLETATSLESKILGIFNNSVLPELANPQSSYTDRIEAILHQIELNLKRHKPDFGIGLLNSIIPSWINDVDPINSLHVETILNKFKKDFEANGLTIFADILNKSILGDSKKFTFIMNPDVDFNKNLIQEEEAKLSNVVNGLTKQDLKQIYANGIELAIEQKIESDPNILPTLTVDDIPIVGESYPTSYENRIQRRKVETNGLTYVTASKSIDYIPTKYYQYFSLFTSCLTNLAGTSQTSINDLETKISKNTGGVSFGVKTVNNPYNLQEIDLRFVLSGSSLEAKSPEIYNLWLEILTQTNFNNDPEVVDKLQQLIKNMSSNQLNNISDRGHSYSNGVGNSKLTPGKYVGDMLGGLSQVEFVSELNSKMESQGKQYLIDEVLPILADLQKLIIDNSKFKYRIVGNSDIISQNEKLIETFDLKISKSSTASYLDELKSLVGKFNTNKLGINTKNTLIDLPFQVGHASLAKLGAPYASKSGAALQVLSQLYTFKHLHSVIRESNGAYGGGLNYDGLGGTINFYSYRDPNPLNSVQSFKDSFDFGLQQNWEASDLEQAKLRIFQSIDAPMSISSQGIGEFHEGITDSMRQERRENFLSVNGDDITDVINKYLIPNGNMITVIGNNEVLNVQEDDEWTIRKLKV